MALRGTDAILVCLKPSAMMTAVSMATRLRAWILPLFYEKLTNPLDTTGTLGALAQSGELCLDPRITSSDYDYIQQEFMAQLEEAKREAFSKLNQVINEYHGTSDPHILNNRSVVLVGDVVFGGLEVEVAKLLLKPLTPATVYATVGNTTIEVSDALHLTVDELQVLDILPSTVMGEDHYFEAPDAYSTVEKLTLASNIATYWT